DVSKTIEEIILNGLSAIIIQTKIVEVISISRSPLMPLSCFIDDFLKEITNNIEPKTRDKLATFDPITLPMTIVPLPSRETKNVVSISGADVPNAITVEPIKKGDNPNFCAVRTEYFSNFPALTHIKLIPAVMAVNAMIILILVLFY
ncbi:MAG: hypothetical protein VYA47_02060, partial [Pseudomonadota bacterium]|nr:hypothetical protein [Pseudomonadota bacterium]